MGIIKVLGKDNPSYPNPPADNPFVPTPQPKFNPPKAPTGTIPEPFGGIMTIRANRVNKVQPD
jgi:hypothetical protein